MNREQRDGLKDVKINPDAVVDGAKVEIIEKSEFELAAKTVENSGLKLHKENHDIKDPKDYHDSKHLNEVKQNAVKIAEILHLSSEQIAVLAVAIAYHDTIIEYNKPDPNNVVGMITRHRGARDGDNAFNLGNVIFVDEKGQEQKGKKGSEGNEGRSAKELRKRMEQANQEAKKVIFSEDQINTGVFAIEVTYPDTNLRLDNEFQGDPFKKYDSFWMAEKNNPALVELIQCLKDEHNIMKGPLFYQPHLEKLLENGESVPREALVVALADLGAVGMGSEDDFSRGGDAEFRELYHNLRDSKVMNRLMTSEDEQSSNDREKVAEKMIGWLEGQIGFAVLQALRFEKIMHLLIKQNEITPQEGNDLRLMFSHYEDNINASLKRFIEMKKNENNKVEKERFLILAGNMGYNTKVK